MPTTLKHLEARIITNSASNGLGTHRWRDRIDGAPDNERRTCDCRDLGAHVHSSHFIRKEMKSYFRTLDGAIAESTGRWRIRVAVERQADLGKQLKNAREDLAAIKGLSERLRGELCTAAGGFEATVAAKQGAVDQLLEDLRGCKPTHHRLAQAQRHQEALVRKVAADGKKAEELAEKQELLLELC